MPQRGDDEREVLCHRARTAMEGSHHLMARARESSLVQRGRAHQTFVRAEQSLNRTAQALPSVFGWAATDGTADGTAEPDDVLALLLDAAMAVYRGCVTVSVTAVGHGADGERRYVTAASTGAAGSLDAHQYGLREGPCVDAVELDQVGVVAAADLDDMYSRLAWPRFSVIAARSGVRSALSIALPWVDALPRYAVAAINLYATDTEVLARREAHGLILGAWAGSRLSGKEPAEVYDTINGRPASLAALWRDQDATGPS